MRGESSIECPKLCKGCPYRQGVDGEPAILGESDWTIQGNISDDRSSVSFEFEDGVPISPRISTIVVANADRKIGNAFSIKGEDWDSGALTQAIENCSGPVLWTDSKFFIKRQKVGCGAIMSLNSSSR